MCYLILLVFSVTLKYFMDGGHTVKALETACARQKATVKLGTRMLAQMEHKEKQAYLDFVLWLRMVWLLGAGHPHLMQWAWTVNADRVDKFFDPEVVKREQVCNCISKDFAEERLDDADAWSLYEPSSRRDILLWCHAREFFAEWNTACNVVQVNISKKMVATPDYIDDQYTRALHAENPVFPNAARPKLQERHDARQKPEAKRQWLSRWRRKWQFKYDKLRNRALVPDEEFFRKVRPHA